MIVRRAFAFAVLFVAAAGVAQTLPPLPLFGPERPFHEGREPLRNGETSSSLRAATDGTNVLAVWGFSLFGGTRIDPSGRVLDVPNLSLPVRGDVFWTGEHYLVAGRGQWTRVTRDGVVVDIPARLFADPFTSGTVRRAWANGRMASLGIANNVLRLVLYDEELRIVKQIELAGNLAQLEYELATNGETFLAVYRTDRFSNPNAGANGALIDRDGNVLSHRMVVEPRASDDLGVASNGEDYFVLTAQGDGIYWGVMVGPDGAPRNVVGSVGLTHGTTSDVQERLFWDGDEFAFFTHTPDPLTGRFVLNDVRLTREGHFSRSTVYPPLGFGTLFVAGSNTLRFNAGMVEFLERGTTSPIAFRARLQTAPAIATTRDGAVSLVVWHEEEGFPASSTVRAARVARDGTVLDREPIFITEGSASRVAVAAIGDQFLVAWSPGEQLRAIRIAADGRKLDPGPLVILNNGVSRADLSIAASNDRYLILWTTTQALAVVVSSSGTALTPLLNLGGAVVGTRSGVPIYAASDGETFGVGWGGAAARLDRNGVRIDLQPANGFVVGMLWDGVGFVSVAEARPDPAGAVYRFARVFAPQSGASVSIETPLPVLQSVRGVCSAGTCFTAGTLVDPSRDVALLRLRITPATAQVLLDRYPASPYGIDPPDSAAIGGTVERPLLLYRRIDREQAGMPRIFVRGVIQPRSRAVTH